MTAGARHLVQRMDFPDQFLTTSITGNLEVTLRTTGESVSQVVFADQREETIGSLLAATRRTLQIRTEVALPRGCEVKLFGPGQDPVRES